MRDRNFQLEKEKNVVFLKIAYPKKLSVWMSLGETRFGSQNNFWKCIQTGTTLGEGD